MSKSSRTLVEKRHWLGIAADAGCFSMALSHGLAEAGQEPKSVETEATVTLEKAGEGFEISRINLAVVAKVPGLGDDEFLVQAEDAKKNCPVSKLLAGAEITLDAKLVT